MSRAHLHYLLLKQKNKKKIFTLLFAATLFTAANAQNGNRDNRQNDQRDNQNGYGNPVATNNDRYDKDDRRDYGKFSKERKRDMQIAQINREYDYKIQKVKSRESRFLEDKRSMEIKRVYMQFNKVRFNDRDYESSRHL